MLNDDSRVCLSGVQLLFSLRGHLINVKMSAEKWDVTAGDSEWEREEDFQDAAENAEKTFYTGARGNGLIYRIDEHFTPQ